MYYPIAIEPGDNKHAYGVIVPDIPGCFSAGDTLDEALLQAEDAILLQLEEYLDNGQTFPPPSPVEDLRNQPEYAGYIWSICKVDASKLSGKVTRVNISLPERILKLIDAAAEREGETRSGFITRAALDHIRQAAH